MNYYKSKLTYCESYKSEELTDIDVTLLSALTERLTELNLTDVFGFSNGAFGPGVWGKTVHEIR